MVTPSPRSPASTMITMIFEKKRASTISRYSPANFSKKQKMAAIHAATGQARRRRLLKEDMSMAPFSSRAPVTPLTSRYRSPNRTLLEHRHLAHRQARARRAGCRARCRRSRVDYFPPSAIERCRYFTTVIHDRARWHADAQVHQRHISR